MMNYGMRFEYEPEYECAGHNQHGMRYKQAGTKQVRVVRMEAKKNNAEDLFDLVILSDRLRVPLNWDYKADPQVAWIEIRAI